MGAGGQLFLQVLAEAVRPRSSLTLSQWSDAHRKLSSKGSSEPGQWRTSRTPYLREIMDCLSARSPVKRVVIMKAAQVGGSEVGLNWLGYIVAHGPAAPTLVVVPTLEVRKRWVKQRLEPLLTETDVLAEVFDAHRQRDRSNSEDMKDFPGGMLVLGGANSPASLASMPIRFVLCDEVDRFPWEVGSEGDPLGLIDERTKTFPRRKVLLVSTPTVKEASRIEEEFEAGDQRRYHVPCPDCGERQWLKWANLKWSVGMDRAWYVCEHCGTEVDEYQKTRMLAEGRWVAEHPERAVRSYHISGLYAPIGLGFTWLELALDWRRCHGDPVKLKRFVNTSLGEVWEDRTHDIKPASLRDRAEPYTLREPPPGCLVLTAGVDVQDDRLAVQIVGWGRHGKSWTIDWVELPGDPGREPVWMALADLLNRPIVNFAGREMKISATAVDTGGHHTHEVYMWVRARRVRRPMAVKGSNVPSSPVLAPRARKQDINWKGKVIKGGVELWMVGSDSAKHVLYRRLAGDAGVDPAGRLVHFSEGLEDDYFDQLVSEVFDPEKNRWVKRRARRNEGLDTWVYAFAASQHPEVRVHSMRARDWDDLQRALEGRIIHEPDPAKGTAQDDLVETPAGTETAAPAAPAIVRAPERQPEKKINPRQGGFVKRW